MLDEEILISESPENTDARHITIKSCLYIDITVAYIDSFFSA